MMHWASELIGRPYKLGAQGPDAFDCWGFVRYAFIHHLGVPDMPQVHVGESNNFSTIRDSAAKSGWHPVATRSPLENDVVLMDSFIGKHIGLVAKANHKLGVLHCVEGVGVTFNEFYQLRSLGFKNLTYWRKTND